MCRIMVNRMKMGFFYDTFGRLGLRGLLKMKFEYAEMQFMCEKERRRESGSTVRRCECDFQARRWLIQVVLIHSFTFLERNNPTKYISQFCASPV